MYFVRQKASHIIGSSTFLDPFDSCIITLQRTEISHLLAVLIFHSNVLVLGLIMACSSQNT